MLLPLAAIDWHMFFFVMFSLVACVFSLAVLFSSHVVHMAFYLIISLGAVAGLFFLAGAEFVGAMQLLIYVGGTLVLLIFGVMLTAQQSFIRMRTASGEWILAAIVGSALLLLLLQAAFSVESWVEPYVAAADAPPVEAQSTTQIGLGFTGVRVDKLEQPNAVLRAGMSGYLLPFVIVSVHLLVVLVGAAYLARAKHYRTREVPRTDRP